MNCPRCDSRIRAEDANLETLVARCRRCDEVFRFSPLLSPAPRVQPPRPRAPRPAAVGVEEHDGVRRLTLPWWRPVTLMLIPQIAICFGIPAYQFGTTSDPLTVVYLLWCVFLWLGMLMVYCSLANTMNHTWVAVDDFCVSADSGPIPVWWSKPVTIERTEIYEFFCDQTIHGHRYGVSVTYNVNVLDRYGRIQRILSYTDRDTARYVADQLDEWLGLGRDPFARTLDSAPARGIWRQ